MPRETIHILLVEDEEAHAEAVRRAFQPIDRAVRLERASTLQEAFAYLEESVPDLVIADWNLPDGKGTDILPSQKELHLFPLVIMTSYGNEELAVATMKAGVLDYVVKTPSTFAEMPHIAERALRQWDLLVENKRAQEALRASEERYRAVVEDQTELICRFSADWKLEFVNAAFLRYFGLTGAAVMGTELMAVVPEEWRHVTEEHLALITLKNPVCEFDVQLTTRKGDLLWLHWTVRGLFDERGNLARFQALGQDVTAQKRAEEALRESERRFKSIFEESWDCIALKDRSLQYVDVNPACERLVGLPASKFKGLRYENVFGLQGAEHINEVESRALPGETIEEENTREINGVLMTFLDTCVPWRDDSGAIRGILAISRDITDRKRTEASFETLEGYPSKAMRATLKKAIIAAEKPSTVLLTGESGSGKDYLARYIHDHSHRAGGPYFAVNCAAISSELAESELFGHEKGAFTGAVGRKRGMLELAEGGTLLLNEIGELSLPLQAKLLAFLDTKKVTRVGGEKEISVNARLIAATNRDLEKAVNEGNFRKDLFYRLNVIRIEVPPLRERLEDIPTLAREIASRLATEMQLTSAPDLDASTVESLVHYHWPGNVRELRNVLERGLILSDGKRFDVTSSALPRQRAASTAHIELQGRTLREVTEEVTRAMLQDALERSKGNKKKAAKLLGIARDTLYRYLDDFGIVPSETT